MPMTRVPQKLVNLVFSTDALLLADTRMGYTSAADFTVSAGDVVFAVAESRGYTVLASGASGQDATTAGGVKLAATTAALLPGDLDGDDIITGTSEDTGLISPAQIQAKLDDYQAALPSAEQIKYMHVIHSYGTSVDAGGATAGSRTVRPLNVVKINEIEGASLSSNVITLPAGVYQITGYSAGFSVNSFKAFIYNITNSTDLMIGTAARSDNSDPSSAMSHFMDKVTLTGVTEIRIEQWVENTNGTAGLGKSVGDGAAEVYARIYIARLGDYVT